MANLKRGELLFHASYMYVIYMCRCVCLYIIVSPVQSTYGGYYGLVVVTPPRPQTLHRSHRIASIFYMYIDIGERMPGSKMGPV